MGILSGLYDGSFGGVSFWEQYQAGLAPEPDLAEEVAFVHIPGSNTTVIQAFGQTIRKLDLIVAVEGAQLSGLRAKVSSTGTLVYHAGSVGARLTGIKTVQAVAGGVDAYKCVLSLVLT